jgi:hypothetical protein
MDYIAKPCFKKTKEREEGGEKGSGELCVCRALEGGDSWLSTTLLLLLFVLCMFLLEASSKCSFLILHFKALACTFSLLKNSRLLLDLF